MTVCWPLHFSSSKMYLSCHMLRKMLVYWVFKLEVAKYTNKIKKKIMYQTSCSCTRLEIIILMDRRLVFSTLLHHIFILTCCIWKKMLIPLLFYIIEFHSWQQDARNHGKKSMGFEAHQASAKKICKTGWFYVIIPRSPFATFKGV